MTGWAEPLYSKSAIDRAGWQYVDPQTGAQDRETALARINNWRGSHAFPLNTIQVSLRKRAYGLDGDATVAQRIKRLPSIEAKIRRFANMKLSRMQDLGGCRAIMRDMDSLHELYRLYRLGNGKHILDRRDDYIFENLKQSGYRGIHLVYRYRSDRKQTYNGLKIKIQLRTRLQHAWATAVETVGFFTSQALKSSRGEDLWLRFFALMGSKIALMERSPAIPDTPDQPSELHRELKKLTGKLGVMDRLTAFGQTLQFAEEHIGAKGAKYFILQLDATQQELRVYKFGNLMAATDYYDALERAAAHEEATDVVLVSVESLAALRRAYPNYFLDTDLFLEIVREATL
jgi:hypothetical protein